MPFLDYVLPDTLSPFVKNLINGLVGFHLLAFVIFIILLVRSFNKTPEDNFREQYQSFEKKTAAANPKKKNLKDD
ncbi:UNKNOWN [Stylonychia lemnae]|uniref:Uncharacterized protein n=1 Tax=Stylonychia lemnae TaxID=5949 RepID=A0A077ZTF6_STYLE|nr:UNKNOWN [Stylonychia lemnae]|eukprot:CDW73167.1 UNKNOWN [Stylonychia lemnae]